ncbi:hypothetical protein C2G38_2095752 [Gigaspora rosea]|uniref:Uncharacterized protein n=1 Tax=Gigaspora rosea TaxID=44941 RepID=A0A397UZ92_9GLOM|nr:hypothetical protein C2G38_2095752 [Gigaspora rosea]
MFVKSILLVGKFLVLHFFFWIIFACVVLNSSRFLYICECVVIFMYRVRILLLLVFC